MYNDLKTTLLPLEVRTVSVEEIKKPLQLPEY